MSREEVEVFLMEVRKDLHDRNIHAYGDVYVKYLSCLYCHGYSNISTGEFVTDARQAPSLRKAIRFALYVGWMLNSDDRQKLFFIEGRWKLLSAIRAVCT